MIALNICISGFTQTQGRGHGMFRLSESMVKAGFAEGVARRVWYLRWNEHRWRRWAEHVALLSLHHNTEVIVAIHAYSWGAGYGAVQLARELRRLGISVRYMVLCDPVYHSRWLPFRWLALVRRDIPLLSPVIRIPANVGEVYCFHQCMNRPTASRLMPENGTIIHPSEKLHCVHEAADDAHAFHRRSLDVAKRLLDVSQEGRREPICYSVEAAREWDHSLEVERRKSEE